MWLERLQNQLSGGYDFINYRWNKFLIEFDRERQRKIGQQMAFSAKITVGLLVVLAVLMNINLLRIKTGSRGRRNKAYRAWIRFEADMKKQGFERKHNETPFEFYQRVNTPQAKQAFEAYAESNYLRD